MGAAENRFNPRTPCGVRLPRTEREAENVWFQSTHSLRSATWNIKHDIFLLQVSIHALLAECDYEKSATRVFEVPFQSTHSLRSATVQKSECVSIKKVSIHALLAECDHFDMGQGAERPGFNPRTPCGVRHPRPASRTAGSGFQSTHSLRSATPKMRLTPTQEAVSIHALLAECDPVDDAGSLHHGSFNPRTPCGVRRIVFAVWQMSTRFNPRTPCGVRPVLVDAEDNYDQFQSTHSLRSATGFINRDRAFSPVSIHALLAECDWKAAP